MSTDVKPLGAIDDYRPPEEKQKDFLFKEVVAHSSAPVWEEKEPRDWRRFPIRDQDGSSSCVAQSMAKLVGLLQELRDGHFVELSAAGLYQRRANRNWGDGLGMIGTDAFNIARTEGLTLAQRFPGCAGSALPSEDVAQGERDPDYEAYGEGDVEDQERHVDCEVVSGHRRASTLSAQAQLSYATSNLLIPGCSDRFGRSCAARRSAGATVRPQATSRSASRPRTIR